MKAIGLAALLLAGVIPAAAQEQPAAVHAVRMVSDLGWSFRADITVRNETTGQRIDAWTLVLNWPGRTLSQVQGARMTAGPEPGRFTFEPPANAGPLAPGTEVTFTVAGMPGDAPPPLLVRLDAVNSPATPGQANRGGGCRETPAALSFSTDRSWDGGYTGRVDIVNKGSAPLTDWLLTFTLDAVIAESWDGTVASHNGNAYGVRPADYFKGLAPGAAARFSSMRRWHPARRRRHRPT